jgi:hypothetical protein
MFQAGVEDLGGEQHLVARTESLEISFDTASGAIRRVRNLSTGQILTESAGPESAGSAPWRLLPQGTSWGPVATSPRAVPDQITPAGFSYHAGPEQAELAWTTSEPGVRVAVTVREEAGGRISLWPRVSVEAGALPPVVLTYPILAGPRELSAGGGHDYLLFPAHTGILVRTPRAQQPFDACYPDGYSGCPVQVTAYYQSDRGGFYLAAHDPHSTWKYFHFSAQEWSVRHEAWDIAAGASMLLDYPVVIGALTAGDWYEAAEIYREWALADAPWCQALADSADGADRADGADSGVARRAECRWLYEDVGLTVWGGPSSLDWSPWYTFYADVAGTPLQITSGWDWPATRPNTVGKEGWLPPRLHPANVEAWRGHHVTPYMNDIFISSSAEGFLDRWEPALMYPYADFTWSRFTQRTMPDSPRLVEVDPRVTTNVDFFPCPASEAQQDLHAWRDAGLMGNDAIAGVCYDISSGNPMLWSRCWRTEHGHPAGRGRDIITAYDDMNKRSKAEARRRTGRYLVQGVETIIENIIDSIDFYVARAGAGPLGALESWLPRPESPPGAGWEIVPLFEAIYHDVGPVRQDGWLTLSEDIGGLFYWAAARIVLQWGAMLSLHYANNPPEKLPAGYRDGPAELIDWDGSRVRFDELPALDPDKAAFAGELARARTALGTSYLSYGVLARPVPPADQELCELDYRRRIESAPRLGLRGTWQVPTVVCGAWRNSGGDIGLFYANVGPDPVTVRLDRDVSGHWGLNPAGRAVRITAGGEASDAGRVGADGRLRTEFAVGGRRVVMVELIAAGAGERL